MNPDFQILLDFLGRCGPEVSGRGFTTPSSEAAIRLQRFAVGDADDAERAEICRMLQMHPAWLRWLADRVKMARNSAQPTTA